LQAGNDGVDVLDGECDVADTRRVRRRGPVSPWCDGEWNLTSMSVPTSETMYREAILLGWKRERTRSGKAVLYAPDTPDEEIGGSPYVLTVPQGVSVLIRHEGGQ
jgi:hypothetical protein